MQSRWWQAMINGNVPLHGSYNHSCMQQNWLGLLIFSFELRIQPDFITRFIWKIISFELRIKIVDAYVFIIMYFVQNFMKYCNWKTMRPENWTCNTITIIFHLPKFTLMNHNLSYFLKKNISNSAKRPIIIYKITYETILYD